MTFKQLCPCVSVSLVVLYPTMKVASKDVDLPKHICKIFKTRGCKGCECLKLE
ncbi:MAG: hypothetical protein DDT22_00238 [candidate division WS2 bacterium]|nr:hypothetical protein [Candidatus Lithacetigena glycinireducens]